MTRAFLLSIAAVLTFAGCGSTGNNSPLTAAVDRLQTVGRGTPSTPSAAQIRSSLTPDVRAQYANRSLKIATLERDNLASLLIETEVNGKTATFFTPDGVSIGLQDGVLVATRGLGFDLMTADVAEVHRGLRTGLRAVRIHRYLDGENRVFINSFICDYAGVSTVTETCFSDGFRIENTYQFDRSGKIIASRQWISPQNGYIRLESAG